MYSLEFYNKRYSVLTNYKSPIQKIWSLQKFINFHPSPLNIIITQTRNNRQVSTKISSKNKIMNLMTPNS